MEFLNKLFGKKQAPGTSDEAIIKPGNIDLPEYERKLAFKGLLYRASELEDLADDNIGSQIPYVDAVSTIDKAAMYFQDPTRLHRDRGRFFYRLSMYDEALTEFETHMNTPGSKGGYDFLGYIYEVLGHRDQAREAYLRFADIKNDKSVVETQLDRLSTKGYVYEDDPYAILTTINDLNLDDKLIALCARRIGRIGDAQALQKLCDLFFLAMQAQKGVSDLRNLLPNIRRKKILASALFQAESSACQQILSNILEQIQEPNLGYATGLALARNNYPHTMDLMMKQKAMTEWGEIFDVLSWIEHPGKINLLKRNMPALKGKAVSEINEYIGSIKGDEAARLLIELNGNSNLIWETGTSESITLIQTGSKVALDFARNKMMKHQQREVRQNLLKGIMLHGDKRAVDIVNKLIYDPIEYVRRVAIQAAITLIPEDFSLIKVISKISGTDKDPWTRDFAKNFLESQA